MNNIELNEMRRSGNLISFDFEYPDELDPVFNYSALRFEYDTDMSNVPDSIAVIPYVGNLVPVAWAYDIELAIPEIDHRFKRALRKVQIVLDRIYPEIGFSGVGGIDADTTVEWGGEKMRLSLQIPANCSLAALTLSRPMSGITANRQTSSQ